MDNRTRDGHRSSTGSSGEVGKSMPNGGIGSHGVAYGDGNQSAWMGNIGQQGHGVLDRNSGNQGFSGDFQNRLGQTYSRQTFPSPGGPSFNHIPMSPYLQNGQTQRRNESYLDQNLSAPPQPPLGPQASLQPNGGRVRNGSGESHLQTFPPPPNHTSQPSPPMKRKSNSGNGSNTEEASVYEAAHVLNGFGSGSGDVESGLGSSRGWESDAAGGIRDGRIGPGVGQGGDSDGTGKPNDLRPEQGGSASSRNPNGNPSQSFFPAALVPALGGSSINAQPASEKKRKGGKQGHVAGANDGDDSRRKTSRACDVCRSKKIRCDILILPHSAGLDGEQHPQGLCTHCKNANLECTFFLPITETRFKKRRGDQEAIVTKTSSPEPMLDVQHVQKPESTGRKRKHSDHIQTPKQPESASSMPSASPRRTVPESPATETSGSFSKDTMPTGRMEGPTSISFLLHTASAIPRGIVESYDIKHHTTWHITTNDGDGIVHVSNPPPSGSFGIHGSSSGEESYGQDSGDGKQVLTAEIISTLVNAYFDHVNPLFPIVSKGEFCAETNPPPLLLYAMAGVAASRRGTPKRVFDGIRTIINGILRNNDVLSDATFFNVQALLICALVGDLHAQPVTTAISASVTRIGTAIRMAQNIGLHRENGAVPETACDMAKIELRRRVWAGCVILDRWCSAVLGIPSIIDLHDVDVLVPSPYEVIPKSDPVAWEPAAIPPYSIIVEQLKLAILLGRILKAIYSPIGITATSDSQLQRLMVDMGAWESNVPAYFSFDAANPSPEAGILHTSYIALQFLFFRPFMRLSYTLPAHINTAMSIKQWTALTAMAKKAIIWLDRNEIVLDTIFTFAYSATNCALVLYHHWIRRSDPEALVSLSLLRDIVTRWEDAVQPDHMSIRRKTIEVMSLLYEAAKKKPSTLMNDPAHEATHNLPGDMNPTTGVGRRSASSSRNFYWQSHPERPGEGIFIARPMAEGLEDIPESIMIRPESQQSPRSVKGGVSTQAGTHPRVDGSASFRIGNVPSVNSMVQSRSETGRPDHNEFSSIGQNSAPGNYLGAEPSIPDSYGPTGIPIISNQQLGSTIPNLNLNPAMTGYGAMFAEQAVPIESDMTMFMNMLDQTADPDAIADAAAMEHAMLGSLPLASYDWSGWEQYFDGLDVAPESCNNLDGLMSGSNGPSGYA